MRAAVSCLLVLAALRAVSAVAPAQPPTFPSRVELVTVDVVVLDREGRPVRGLTRDDFTVEEDGRPQEVVSFEAYVAEAPAAAPSLPSVLASNEVERPASARAFAVLVDDLGMAMQDAVETRRAVTTFLERSVRDGDEAILATTSGDVWWSARLPDGRADLLAVVARLKGRRSEISMSFDYISDYAAFSISDRESAGGPSSSAWSTDGRRLGSASREREAAVSSPAPRWCARVRAELIPTVARGPAGSSLRCGAGLPRSLPYTAASRCSCFRRASSRTRSRRRATSWPRPARRARPCTS